VESNNNNQSALVYIHTHHPLVFDTLRKALHADLTECCEVKLAPRLPTQNVGRSGILVLDCCSESSWPSIALHWQRFNWKIIVLSSSNAAVSQEELRALYLGISGVVAMSDNCPGDLCSAVKSILDGKLWISRNALNAFIRNMKPSSQCYSDSSRRFTFREEQVLDCVLQKLSNKEISTVLGISERTVKYHVSNIFQKCRVRKRKDLLTAPEVPAVNLYQYPRASW